MSTQIKNDFSQGEVWRCITHMAVPMATAMLVNVLYSIVDRIYIGHIKNIGSLALTGLGLSMPLISIIAAFAALCGTGGGPLCSIERGKGNLEKAEKILGNTFSILLFLGIILTAIVLLFLEPLLKIFGASDQTLPYAAEYASIYSCGTIFVMISLGMNPLINAQGFARVGMLTVLIGAIINIVLDPLLIFVLDMGIAGAAIATVLSQLCSALWVILFLSSKKAILKIRPSYMKPSLLLIKPILGLGITGFIVQATNSLVQICCNRQLRRYGGDLYVGAMTVITSVREFIIMIIRGLNEGAKPVLGYNYGAGLSERVKEGIRFISLTGASYAFFIWLIIMLFPAQIVKLFNDDPDLIQVCVPSIRIYFCGFAFMSLQTAGQTTFQSLGMARKSMFFSLFRKVFIVVALVYILPTIPIFEVYGVFWSEPISDLIGGFACYLTMYFTVYRKLNRLGAYNHII